MRKTTKGETLFYLLRDEGLQRCGRGHVRWTNVGELFEVIRGSDDYFEYVKGATAIFAMRRLLRFWKDEKHRYASEYQHVGKVSAFVRAELFNHLDVDICSKIARATVAAELSSDRPIPPGVRKEIVNQKSRLTCYLCNAVLDPLAKESTPEHLTLEHIWPKSMGGDSIEDNLLPACSACQNTTKDCLSWEWYNIHNLMLPNEPSESAKNSVGARARYARHYFEAIRCAAENKISLKAAFVTLGPIRAELDHVYTGFPVTFFDIKTIGV